MALKYIIHYFHLLKNKYTTIFEFYLGVWTMNEKEISDMLYKLHRAESDMHRVLNRQQISGITSCFLVKQNISAIIFIN